MKKIEGKYFVGVVISFIILLGAFTGAIIDINNLERQLERSQILGGINYNSFSIWKYNGVDWTNYICVGDIYIDGDKLNFSISERLTCIDGENCEVWRDEVK